MARKIVRRTNQRAVKWPRKRKGQIGWKHIGGGCLLEGGNTGRCPCPCDDEYEHEGTGRRVAFDTTYEAHFSMPAWVSKLSELNHVKGVHRSAPDAVKSESRSSAEIAGAEMGLRLFEQGQRSVIDALLDYRHRLLGRPEGEVRRPCDCGGAVILHVKSRTKREFVCYDCGKKRVVDRTGGWLKVTASIGRRARRP